MLKMILIVLPFMAPSVRADEDWLAPAPVSGTQVELSARIAVAANERLIPGLRVRALAVKHSM